MTKNMNSLKRVFVALLVAASSTAFGDAPAVTIRPAGSNIRDLQIRGRVQGQFGYARAKNDEGSDSYNTFELRRVRMGMRGTLFQNVRAQVEANLVPGSSLSMRTAFIEWREHREAYIKLGFDKPRFGFEENTSSAEILTIERSLISNAMIPGAMNGLSLAGSVDILSYAAGVYTDSENRNSDGTEDYLFNASLQLTLDDLVPVSNLRLRGDYLHSADEGGNFGGRFEDALAASVHAKQGAFDVRAEFMWASDRDNNDVSGFYVTPSYQVNEQLQGVLRFEMARSDKDQGLGAPGRYLSRVSSLAVRSSDDDDTIPTVNPQRGDKYSALYLGANYYFAGNNNKLMAGVELSQLDNTDAGKLKGTTVYSAWRMLF